MAKINFKKIFFIILTLETIIISATIYRYNLPLFPGEKTVNLMALNTLQKNIQGLMVSKNTEEKIEEQVQITDEMIRLVSREIEINSVKIKKQRNSISTAKAITKILPIKIAKTIAENENVKSINNDELISLSGFKKEKIKIQKININDDLIKEETISLSSSAIQKVEEIKKEPAEELIVEDEITEYDYSKPTSFMDKKLSQNVLKVIERESDKKLVMSSPIKQGPNLKEVIKDVALEEKLDEYSPEDNMVIYDYEKTNTKTQPQSQEKISNFLNLESATKLNVRIKNQNEEEEFRIINLADDSTESLAMSNEETTIDTYGDVYSARFEFKDYPTVQTELTKGSNNIYLPSREDLDKMNIDQDKGLIIIKANKDVQVVGIGHDNEVLYYDDSYEKAKDENAKYVIIKNAEVGLFWLKFKLNGQEFKRWINIGPSTIQYLNVVLEEKIERINLKMKQLIDEDVDLNIQEKVLSLNQNKIMNKIALNKYQAKTISDKAQSNLIKLINDKERSYLISYKNEKDLIYPGKNIIDYALEKTGLRDIGQACVIFSKPRQGLVRNKLNGYSSGNNMFIDYKYLLKNGDIESEPGESVEWIMIYGEGEGQIFIENEYSESSTEQKTVPCLNNTVLVDHL